MHYGQLFAWKVIFPIEISYHRFEISFKIKLIKNKRLGVQMNPLKGIIVADADGNYKLTSPEELLAQRKNNWQEWKCAAGTDNIHITPDGNVYSATCKVGGLLGNVFDFGMSFPKTWVVCTKKWCMCGADMQLRKSKYLDQVELDHSLFMNPVDQVIDPTIVGNAFYQSLRHYSKNITWDIGRRCNFKCSYCPPSTSNNYESHKSWGSLRFATDLILKDFCRGVNAKWVFTGGEPTLNPSFIELVKYLISKKQIIHVQTNGSLNADYYEELIEFASIGISIHLEESDLTKLLKNVSGMVRKKQTHDMARHNVLNLRIMVPPGYLSNAIEYIDSFKNLAGYKSEFDVTLSVVYKKENGDFLMDYDGKELEIITSMS